MLYTLVVSSLLFLSSFGALQIALFEHNSAVNPIEENCVIQPEISIRPDYEAMTDGYQVIPCVWGQFTEGTILRYVWKQEDTDEILIESVYEYNDATTQKRILEEKQSYFRIWRKIQPSVSGDFSVKVKVEIYENDVFQDSVLLTVNRPIQSVGYDSNLFAIRATEPSNWEDCIVDSDAEDIENILTNGGLLYICVIYKVPICPNDSNNLKTSFSINVIGEVSGTYAGHSEDYATGFNARRIESYQSINVLSGETGLQVTASMDSYGQTLSQTRQIQFS